MSVVENGVGEWTGRRGDGRGVGTVYHVAGGVRIGS